MKKSELTEILKEIGDDQDINETIQGIEGLIKPLDLEGFKYLLANNEIIKGYHTSLVDSAISKGVESFKKNKMPTYIEEEIKKRSNEGKSEAEIKLEEALAKLEAKDKEIARKKLESKYTKTLTDKGLPVDLIDFILSDDENIINNNILKFESMLNPYVDSKVNERLKGSYKPPKSAGNVGKITWEEYLANPTEENYKLYKQQDTK